MPYARQYTAQFGAGVDKGLEAQEAFPYIYTLVSSENDTWETTHGLSDAGNMSDIGPVLPRRVPVKWPVILDTDYNFLLLRIAYTVYKFIEGNHQFFWYTVSNFDAADYQKDVGSPLLDFIKVNLAWLNDERQIYGRLNNDINVTTLPSGAPLPDNMIPLSMNAAQGYEYRPGSIRSPFLLPAGGTMLFTFLNDIPAAFSRYTVVVGAMIYGLKIRI